MSAELHDRLVRQAKELCVFYEYLSFLDQGILLSLLAAMSEDYTKAENFVKKLKHKKRYQKFTQNNIFVG